MLTLLQIVTVILVAVAMALALAHALELPGKMRLDNKTYYAVQEIYYPGFTIDGGIGEAGGTVATIVLLLLTRRASGMCADELYRAAHCDLLQRITEIEW
jgi:hypothetical protein